MPPREGETVHFPIAVDRTEIADARSITVDWGDGTIETLTDMASIAQGLPTHVYVDDSGDGAYLTRLTIVHGDGSETVREAKFKVADVAPRLIDLGGEIDAETDGDRIVVTGRIVDPGILDSHGVTVRWSDGTTTEARIERKQGEIRFIAETTRQGSPVATEHVTLTVRDLARPTSTSQQRFEIKAHRPAQVSNQLRPHDHQTHATRHIEAGRAASFAEMAFAGMIALGTARPRATESSRDALLLQRSRAPGRRGGKLTQDRDLQTHRHTLPVSFRSQGGVRAIVFTLDYDPQVATLIDASPRFQSNGSTPRLSLEVTADEAGRGKASIALHADHALARGTLELFDLIVEGGPNLTETWLRLTVDTINGKKPGSKSTAKVALASEAAGAPAIAWEREIKDIGLGSGNAAWKREVLADGRKIDLEQLRIPAFPPGEPKNLEQSLPFGP